MEDNLDNDQHYNAVEKIDEFNLHCLMTVNTIYSVFSLIAYWHCCRKDKHLAFRLQEPMLRPTTLL